MACNIVTQWALYRLAGLPEEDFDEAVRAGHIAFLGLLLARDLVAEATAYREKIARLS